MTNAALALRVSLVARIASQYAHEMAFGMWNPDFCSADAKWPRKRFLEEMDRILEDIRNPVGQPSND